MSSTLSSARSVDATLVPADTNVSTDSKNERFLVTWRLLDKQTLLAIAFPITFCIGIAAGSVWQSSRETIMPIPQAAPAPGAPSSNLEPKLEAMSLGLAAVRQSVEQLAAAQQQMTDEIAKLQVTEQEILDKVSGPPRPAAATAPARKSAPPAPPLSSQGPPAR